MQKHIQVVAAIHIALGFLSLLAAIIIFAALGLAGGIVIAQGQHQAAGILGIVAIAVGGLLTVLSLPGLLGGWALYSGRSWGRPCILVLGVIDLLNIPFGTALGIYTLWALLHEPQPRPPGA
ncbi:MAG: hypothetical protein P4N60_11075 [Verrucomicrobiae bacterium]|nr:hypothetical protein [Verrucomicrobiae bacterium]